MKIRDQEAKRGILTLTDFLGPRANHQGCDTAVQPPGSLSKGLIDILINLNGSEGMGKVADIARPDILSYLLRN